MALVKIIFLVLVQTNDLNMKLWKEGVRIFKGLQNFKIYHFGSIIFTLPKKKV